MKHNFVKILLNVGRLKSIKRTGWVREGMPDPESVAEHTFRVCFLALLLGKRLELSLEDLLGMAIVHDIEEAVTNDPVTQRGKKNVKSHNHQEEKKVVDELFLGLPNQVELLKLWEKHFPQSRKGASRESSILYQLGKIATSWQALEYELAGADPGKLDEFWENAKVYVTEPLLLKILNDLEGYRNK